MYRVSGFFFLGYFSPFLFEPWDEGRDQKNDSEDKRSRSQRPREENGEIPLGRDQRLSQIVLHHRSEDERQDQGAPSYSNFFIKYPRIPKMSMI